MSGQSRRVFSLIGLVVLAVAALAAPSPQVSATAPRVAAKAAVAVPLTPAASTPISGGLRQGGDTILEAVFLALPVDWEGTTTGYTNDYDEICPYVGSTAPDVVYTFTPIHDMAIDIDMAGSAYDTKIYVYDEDLAVVACNDDYYSDYTSRLENVPLAGAEQYYLIIDGYGEASGDYQLRITEYEPCELSIPVNVTEELEPPLGDDYVDDYNGGCNTDDQNPPFQPDWGFGPFHGRSGWYLYFGAARRDTDWFELWLPPYTPLEIEGDAEQACYMFELAPQDCGSVSVVQSAAIGPCSPAVLTITGSGSVWFWVGPQAFTPPDGFVGYEFDYLLVHSGGAVPTENRTWTSVKDIFR
ncbi:MAG TPA: hypothetical protein PLL30_01085 [Candidatus Krumholzibacteria bacterium]|nr:hypothetical protein [Candidatus Krumholzibacteria bacterium]HPD70356.1 hypothetical protein [Candidatus Krumholzibacteria bacterium]HRY39944.1 hypothetical protein [Candidatus Krumholzibacteria bacterium]